MNLLHRTVVVVRGPGGQAVRTEYLHIIGNRPPKVGKGQHALLQIGNGDQRTAVRTVGCGIRRVGEIARQKTLAGWRIRIDPPSALRQPLREPFVVSEDEHLILLYRTSNGSPELVPFERTL